MALNIHPVLISILVVLVIVTLVFTFLVIHENGQITTMIKGDGEGNSRNTLTALKGENDDLKQKVNAALEAIELRKREVYRGELELAKVRVAMAGDKVLAGVATPDEQELDGRRLKDSQWALTRDLLKISVNDMDGLKQEHESPARQKFLKLEEAIASRQNELQAVLKRINDQEAEFKTDQERLNAQVDNLNKEKDKAEKMNREDFSRRATRIGQLEDKIRTLLELELRWLHDLDPVAKLLEVSPTSPHAIMNLGSADRVVPGLKFEVFQYDRGRYVEKGMVEVVKTESQIATVRILSVIDEKNAPISHNDYLGNPVFSTKRPKVFVVSGEFKTHNKEDLEMFIRQTGGIVRDKLSPGVDFLIAGERSDKDQDNAREYQVLAMTEAQLLKYIRRDYKPK